MSWWQAFFGWPGGGIWANLAASAACGALGVGWLHSRARARHIAAIVLAARHHHEQLEQAQQHHAELLAAVAEAPPTAITAMPPAEFERQLRALKRRKPQEFRKLVSGL